MRLRAEGRVGFIDLIMVLAQRGYLRQMGDGDDLTAFRHLPHDRSHLGGDIPAHTGIYLIEDNGRKTFRIGYQRFDAQHQSADLTAGRHLAHGPQTLIEIRGKHQLHLVAAFWREVFCLRDRNLHFGVRHAQALQSFLQALAYLRHDSFAAFRQRLSGLLKGFALFLRLFLGLLDIEIETVHPLDLLRQRIALLDQLLNRLYTEFLQ